MKPSQGDLAVSASDLATAERLLQLAEQAQAAIAHLPYAVQDELASQLPICIRRGRSEVRHAVLIDAMQQGRAIRSATVLRLVPKTGARRAATANSDNPP